MQKHLLAKDTGRFAAFIQTAVSRQLTSSVCGSSPNSLSNYKCLITKHAMFDGQLDHFFTSLDHS